MQTYQSHKRVKAAEIRMVDVTKLMFDEGIPPVMVTLDFIEKHKPKSGDFYVVYEDGYASISPSHAFTSGYAPVDSDAPDAPDTPPPDAPDTPPPVAMRAKMRLNSVNGDYPGYEVLSFSAVAKSEPYGDDGYDENNTYAKFSPSGRLDLTVANPNLLGKFKVGEEYYLDFTKAKDAPVIEPVTQQEPEKTGDQVT